MYLGKQFSQIYTADIYLDKILKIIRAFILLYGLFFSISAFCEIKYYAPDGTIVTKEEYDKITKDYEDKFSTKQMTSNKLKAAED